MELTEGGIDRHCEGSPWGAAAAAAMVAFEVALDSMSFAGVAHCRRASRLRCCSGRFAAVEAYTLTEAGTAAATHPAKIK